MAADGGVPRPAVRKEDVGSRNRRLTDPGEHYYAPAYAPVFAVEGRRVRGKRSGQLAFRCSTSSTI